MTTARRLVCTALMPLALSACGGSSSAADAQSSPEGLVRTAYQDLAAGEFGKVCDLVLPDARAKFTRIGSDCQGYLAKQYDPAKRAALKGVKIDASRTRTNGDTAVVPEDAVTFRGQPSSDADTTTAKQDGKWWLTLDQ